jgi:hypothetical protein
MTPVVLVPNEEQNRIVLKRIKARRGISSFLNYVSSITLFAKMSSYFCTIKYNKIK